jgi:hypothetical protein
MAEIHGQLGPRFACHVIQQQGLQPHPGILTPTPVRLQPLGSPSRPTADPVPSRLAGVHYVDSTTGFASSR